MGIYQDTLTYSMLFERIASLSRENENFGKRIEEMAATIKEATDQVTAMQQTFDAFKTGVTTSVTHLQAQVTDLQNQINQGGAVDLTALSAALDTFKADLDSSPPPVV